MGRCQIESSPRRGCLIESDPTGGGGFIENQNIAVQSRIHELVHEQMESIRRIDKKKRMSKGSQEE